LTGEDLRDLEDLGLLPKEALESDSENGNGNPDVTEMQQAEPEIEERDIVPWFETLVQGSKLGKLRRMRGQKQSTDGRRRVEWEIMEWTDDAGESDAAASSKRKLDAMASGETIMTGGI